MQVKNYMLLLEHEIYMTSRTGDKALDRSSKQVHIV